MTGTPILVGVDGSDCGLVAVDLAVREAALRERPVRVVYCDPWADHPAWAHNDPAGDLLSDRADTGEVQVTGEVLAGSPAKVLIRE